MLHKHRGIYAVKLVKDNNFNLTIFTIGFPSVTNKNEGVLISP